MPGRERAVHAPSPSRFRLDVLENERGYPCKALVAFSGTVRDGGVDYTEPGMNGLPESRTAATFERPEYRFLVVANKFQTGDKNDPSRLLKNAAVRFNLGHGRSSHAAHVYANRAPR